MKRIIILVTLLSSSLDLTAGQGRIVILNTDPAGVGFNDPTVVVPVGGNSGVTLGQQRLAVFEAAAERWDSIIETDVDIVVRASFAPIGACTATSAVLGHAKPWAWDHDFPQAPQPGVLYPIALANALSGVDRQPGQPDIFMGFNADIDNETCLGSSNWYYGLDNQHGPDSDLFVVVLHELAHGLGIAGAGREDYSFSGGMPSAFDTHILDLTTGQRWPQMSEQQRKASLNNTTNLVWSGPAVRERAARFLEPVTLFNVTEPAAIAGTYDIGQATFGPAIDNAVISGRLVLAQDAANDDGPATTDGCSTFTNAGSVDGNVAVVDRGTCTFVSKALNAQAAGATALVILDNSRETCMPPAMGGDGDDVEIPVISIGALDGDALKTQLPAAAVRGRLHRDPTLLAGASSEGYVRLYAPCTTSPGSSKHHWDTPAQPNLLMEPSVNSDLLHGVDLTRQMLIDIGWPQRERSGRRAVRR